MQFADIRPARKRKALILAIAPAAIVLYMAMTTVAQPLLAFLEMMAMFTEAWHGRRILEK